MSSARTISRAEAKDFCAKWHYAGKVFPAVSQLHFGFFKEDRLVGVCVFGVPASQWVSVSCVGVRDKCLELQRFALSENVKNDATRFLSLVWGILPKLYRGVIVSYSDTAQNHHGGIYQAFGFNYAGCSKPRTDPLQDGHPRHTTGDPTQRRGRSGKHRYWLTVPRGRFDKTVKWEKMKYPKPTPKEPQ